MRHTVVKLSVAILLASCSNNTQNTHENITQLENKKNNKTFLIGPAEVIQKAQSQMDGLASYIQSSGGDIKKVFNELNQISNPSDNSYSQNFARGILADDGRLTCIQDYKVAVDFDPRSIGKDVNKFHGISYSLVNDAIKEFEKTPDSEIMTTYADLETNIKDPKDQKKLLSQKYVLVIYGRKALLGEKLNKQQHSKFMCYVAYPVK
jgi:hypothetical protein